MTFYTKSAIDVASRNAVDERVYFCLVVTCSFLSFAQRKEICRLLLQIFGDDDIGLEIMLISIFEGNRCSNKFCVMVSYYIY